MNIKIFFFFIIGLLLATVLPFSVHAVENNKVGIHLAQPPDDDIEKAAKLVNSNGGDWGYVTVVIAENDRDHNKWQNVFNQFSRLHLIPIVRIATKPDGNNWKVPAKEDADGWASFLNGLHWVVKNRYVILFNEPNHATEWGGKVDPVGYADIAKAFATELKKKSPDYVVMLAGLDASAPDQFPAYADEDYFLRRVVTRIGVDDFNQLFGGLSSHSYPNPGFSGSPSDSGRGTVRTYEWELDLLKSEGVKDLPVFITETGWDGNNLSRDTVADYYKQAFQNVWLPDPRVMAVTPFVLNYQSDPFLSFSFAKPGNSEYFPQYKTIQDIPKVKGDPEREISGNIECNLPGELVINSTFHFSCTLENTGQTDWDEKSGYVIKLDGVDPSTYFFSSYDPIPPLHTNYIDLYIKTGDDLKHKKTQIVMQYKDKIFAKSAPWEYTIIALPSLSFNVDLYPKLQDAGSDYEVQIFDEKQDLVYKVKGIEVKNKQGSIPAVYNIALGEKYRVVILKPYYLPRQEFVTFHKGDNKISFKMLYPFDFNQNGRFDWGDFWALVQKPYLVRLLVP